MKLLFLLRGMEFKDFGASKQKDFLVARVPGIVSILILSPAHKMLPRRLRGLLRILPMLVGPLGGFRGLSVLLFSRVPLIRI